MSDQEWEVPACNWFGGYLVARELLLYSKAQADDESKDSFLAKMNRQNFIARVQVITMALNIFGPTLEGAQAIQMGGKGFFNDLSAELLATKLSEAVEMLAKPIVWKFRVGEFGSLDFSAVPGEAGGCDE